MEWLRKIEPEAKTYDRQFLVEHRVFDRFYPDLTEEMKDGIDYVLSGVVRGILETGIGCSLTRSLVPRLCLSTSSDSPDRVELVRRKFSSLREGITSETPEDTQKVISELARGPYDLDIKMAVAENRQLDFGKDLVASVVQLLKDQFGEGLSVVDDVGNRAVLVYGDFKIEAVFGEVPLKPDIKHTEINFYQGEEKVFKAHFGFEPKTVKARLKDTRSGFTITRKLDAYLPLYLENEAVVVKEEDVKSQREILLGPDEYTLKYESDGKPEKDLELVLRAIRYAIFFHGELTDIDSDLFTKKTWENLSEMVKYAAEYFSKPGALVNSELERQYLKEILVCFEADPYLFLLISEKIGLLRLFPFFKDRPSYIARVLLVSDSLTFEMEDGSLLSPSKRDLLAILRQREMFLRNDTSGLRIIHDAFKERDKRGEMEDRITVEDFDNLVKVFGLAEATQSVSVRPELSAEYQRNFYRKVNSLLVGAMKESVWKKYKVKDYCAVLSQALKRLVEFSTTATEEHFSFENFKNFVKEKDEFPSYFTESDYFPILMNIFKYLLDIGVVESLFVEGPITKRTYFISPPNVVEDRLRKGVLLRLNSSLKNQIMIKWEDS